MLPTIPIRWLLCCLFLLAACEDSAGLGTGKPDGLMDAASRDMSIPGNGEGNISNSDSSAPFSASDIEGNWFACEGPDCTRLMDWGVRFTLEGTFQELLVNEWRDSKSGVTSFCEDKEAIFSYVISANSPQIHLDSSSQHLTVGTYELQIIESKLLLKMDGRAFYFKKDLQAQKVEQCTAIKGFECEDGSWADITDMPACYAFLRLQILFK